MAYGSVDKVAEKYGFNDLEDLKKELFTIEKENSLIRKEQVSLTENIDVTPEEVVAPLSEQSKKEAAPAPQQVEAAEEVVVVAPGESAFDDGKNEHEAVASEEMSSEPVLSPEEQDVFESMVTQDKEPEKNSAPQKENVSTEEDSFL